MFACWGWRHDPGPCPVDDTPHTACTPESVALQRAADAALGATTGTRVVVPVEPPSGVLASFSTTSYRRALHGPAIGVRRGR